MPVDEGGSMNPYAAVKWIWIVYLGVCVLASFVQKRSIRQQSAGSSLLQMGIVLVVPAPFFVVGRRFGILSRHFVPSRRRSNIWAYC